MDSEGQLYPESQLYHQISPLSIIIRAVENGFIVTTSGGSRRAKTYIANTLEHVQSLTETHFNSGE